MLTIGFVNAFENYTPPCVKCKWFISHPNGAEEYGFCKQFNTFFYSKEETMVMNEYALHCRKNEHQCGPIGYLFEPKDVWNVLDIKFHFLKELKKMEEKYDLQELEEKKKELEDQICGEVNEKQDLEEWDKEYAIINKRISTLSTFKKSGAKNP
jgi:hypothetical protein